jgi:hypothetical protein
MMDGHELEPGMAVAGTASWSDAENTWMSIELGLPKTIRPALLLFFFEIHISLI